MADGLQMDFFLYFSPIFISSFLPPIFFPLRFFPSFASFFPAMFICRRVFLEMDHPQFTQTTAFLSFFPPFFLSSFWCVHWREVKVKSNSKLRIRLYMVIIIVLCNGLLCYGVHHFIVFELHSCVNKWHVPLNIHRFITDKK